MPSTPPSSASALILLAHGSRDTLWRQPFEAIAAQLQALRPDCTVATAYISLCGPSLEDCAQSLIAQGAQHILIAPLFLGAGQHIKEDLPRLQKALQTQSPSVTFEILPLLGENPQLQSLIAQTLSHALPPP